MEENKNSESSFSDGLLISDDELEKSYTHSKVNEGFKQLKAQIEGLTDIIGPKIFTEQDLADPSTVDASVVEFSRKPTKFLPRANQMDMLEGQLEGKEQTGEMNELLMQWIRKLIEEKKEGDKTIAELMKSRSSEVNKEQNLKRSNDKLKEKNRLLEKRVTELQQSLQESEIQKRSIENTLRLTIESGFNKIALSPETNAKLEESKVISKLREELIQKEKEIEAVNKKTERLSEAFEHVTANYKTEIDLLRKSNKRVKLALVTFKEKLEEGMAKLYNEVGKKSEELREKIVSIAELTARPNILKLWIIKNGKEGLIKYLAKLKDSIEDIRKIQEEMKNIKRFTWKLRPFYRVF